MASYATSASPLGRLAAVALGVFAIVGLTIELSIDASTRRALALSGALLVASYVVGAVTIWFAGRDWPARRAVAAALGAHRAGAWSPSSPPRLTRTMRTERALVRRPRVPHGSWSRSASRSRAEFRAHFDARGRGAR